MKNYTDKLNNVGEIETIKYHKDPAVLGFWGVKLPHITIHSMDNGVHTVTIGDDPNTQEITETQALHYINAQGGHSLTP